MRNPVDKSKRALVMLSAALLGFALSGSASRQSPGAPWPAANQIAAQEPKLPPWEISQEGYLFADGKYTTVKDAKAMSPRRLCQACQDWYSRPRAHDD